MYWLHYIADLVAQKVMNPPAMQETQVWSLGWEYPLEKWMATQSSILAWRIPRTGVAKSWTQLGHFHIFDERWNRDSLCLLGYSSFFASVYSVQLSSVIKSCLTLLWTVGHQAPASMGFPSQEYWSGLPFPSPGDIPNPGIKPGSLAL